MLTLFAIKPVMLLALFDVMLTLAMLRSRLLHITVWDPCTVSPTRKLESVQRRAARYTLGQYRRMSSVVLYYANPTGLALNLQHTEVELYYGRRRYNI